MKIRRFPFAFVFLFVLLTLSFIDNFRRSSEEKLNVFLTFKDSDIPIVAINTDAQKPIKSKENYRRCDVFFVEDFEEVLFSANFKDESTGYRAYIDFDSFVDWYIVNEFTKNHDAWFQDSCFLFYSSADKKIHMGPIWDFDISCGNNKNECADPTGFFIQSRHWFKRLWEDEFFREKVAERWKKCSPQVWESFDWIEEQANFLEDDANFDDKIWQRFGYRQWPNAPGYKERKTYRAEVDYMLNWLKTRAQWLDNEWGF